MYLKWIVYGTHSADNVEQEGEVQLQKLLHWILLTTSNLIHKNVHVKERYSLYPNF